jgi:hypothetical protein
MNEQHERHHFLREHLRGEKLLTPPVAAELELPWRVNGILLQLVFFVLTAIALAVFAVLTDRGVAGVAAIALAEYLIGRRHWAFTGIESALWLGAMMAFISLLPSIGTPESNLVIAAACAIAALRVRNPLIGAGAMVFVVLWAEKRFDLGTVAALLVAVAAMFALLRTWRRPTTEWFFIALALVMPVAGRFLADEQWRTVTILLYCAFAALALSLAIARRHHALFLAAMIATVIVATDVAARIELAAETKLAVAGALLLAIAFAVTRALRERTTGFVLTPAKFTPLDEELQLMATLALKPETPESETPQSGGGSFGGAGASGGWESPTR